MNGFRIALIALVLMRALAAGCSRPAPTGSGAEPVARSGDGGGGGY